MSKLIFRIAMLCLITFSCGPRPTRSVSTMVTETDVYVSKVDANAGLKKETLEGALTDTQGLTDIGSFKYTVYFDEQTKMLYRIKNVETTDKTISENYYFDNGNLVLIEAQLGDGKHKLYIRKNKIISESKTAPATQNLLLDKAERFHKAFKKTH